MFIAWCAVILGSVPFDAADAAVAAGETFDPLALLRSSGDAFGEGPHGLGCASAAPRHLGRASAVGEVVRVFSLLAVSTSFVGFYYGLTDFFADALGLDQRNERAAAAGGGAAAAAGAAERGEEPREEGDAAARRTPQQRALLTALALLPPLGFALSDPSIFFSALDNAGTYGILTLFGIIPAAMAWAQRYGDGDAEPGDAVAPAALPGGRATLVAMIVAAGAVVSVETWERLAAAGWAGA